MVNHEEDVEKRMIMMMKMVIMMIRMMRMV